MQPSMKSSMLWNASGNIIYLAAQWIVTVMVTRISGFEDAGVLSLAMSISATFQTLAMFGIRSFQVSDINSEFSDTTYVNFRNISCVTSLLVCALFSVIGGYSLTQITAIILFMVFRIAESYSDVLHGIAQKENRLDIAGKAFAIKGVLIIVCFFSGYLIFQSLNIGLLFMAVSSCISTVIYDLLQTRRLSAFSLIESPGTCIPLAKKGLPLCVYLFLFSGISTVPKLVLEKMCSEAVLGAYSSIFAPALLIQAATGYIYNPFATVFAENYRDGKYGNFLKTMLKISAIIAGIGAVILLLSTLLGEFVMKLIFGQTIAEYVYLLNPILLATMLISLMGFLCMLEIVIRDFKGLITGCAVGFLSAAVLSFVMIEKIGANGTSYALIIASIASVAVLITFILCKIHSQKCNNF